MSKHTPGPWVLDTIPTSVGICHRIGPFPPRHPDDVTVRHACLYADYPSASNPADEELEANARLIVAAPELLDALVNLLPLISPLKAESQQVADAYAAIAKATA
ncbi:hypothetical protein [Pseudomonas aeruginosa]|uniref:hypothetical protein n=1 Tax=Pseudomonas aeruginosa TaxID=287 RepID=UPI003983BCC7